MRHNMVKFLSVLVAAAFLCACAPGTQPQPDVEDTDITAPWAGPGLLLGDAYPDKSAYSPGDTVTITAQLHNGTAQDFAGEIQLAILRDVDVVEQSSTPVELADGESREITFAWTAQTEDYTGYLVRISAVQGDEVIDRSISAIDVSSGWERYPRYGYLCRYPQMTDAEIDAVVAELSKFHLNGLQFYDWQDTHDVPLAGTMEDPHEVWRDIANNPVYADTITGFIDAMHERNMMAGNYTLMFGAYEGFEERGISARWGLYTDINHQNMDRHPLPESWESDIYLMNPGNPDWRRFYFAREQETFEVYPFDCFHIDTLGHRGGLFDYDGQPVQLDRQYAAFVAEAKAALPGVTVIMNAVDTYGAQAAAQGGADFFYTEVWSGTSYNDLVRVIADDYRNGGWQRGSVLAAYMNYETTGKDMNAHAVKLTNAAIFSAGGAHIELGDTGMLSSEYYPNNKMTLGRELRRDLRAYYSVLTAYEHILRGERTDTAFEGSIGRHRVSAQARGGAIWARGTDTERFSTVQLINLLSKGDADWRDNRYTCPAPQTVQNAPVTMTWPGDAPKGVYMVSPDVQSGDILPLEYTLEDGQLAFTLPYLEYWDMILIEK